jgi:soluble lytic murein transglycosylase-like protein
MNGTRLVRTGVWAACLAAIVAFDAAAEEIYYRRDSSGALVLTNVPDHQDLRAVRADTRLPGLHSGEAYRELIWRTALKQGVAPDLVYAVAAVESNFNARAVSAKGAQGLMQLMPETAARFGVIDPFNPADNVLGGARYLRYLIDLFNGDLRLALAAYNAGENIVMTLKSVPPYPETAGYVRKVMKLFGGKPPLVQKKAGQAVLGGRATQTAIYGYTDGQGVVHITDQPPAAAPSPAGPGTSGSN